MPMNPGGGAWPGGSSEPRLHMYVYWIETSVGLGPMHLHGPADARHLAKRDEKLESLTSLDCIS